MYVENADCPHLTFSIITKGESGFGHEPLQRMLAQISLAAALENQRPGAPAGVGRW